MTSTPIFSAPILQVQYTLPSGATVSKSVIDIGLDGADQTQIGNTLHFNDPVLTMDWKALRGMAVNKGSDTIVEGCGFPSALFNVHSTGVPLTADAPVNLDSNRRTLTQLRQQLCPIPTARWVLDTTPGQESFKIVTAGQLMISG